MLSCSKQRGSIVGPVSTAAGLQWRLGFLSGPKITPADRLAEEAKSLFFAVFLV
jgi:hypothetical protein